MLEIPTTAATHVMNSAGGDALFISPGLCAGLLSVLTQQGAALSVKDPEGRYVWVNETMAAILGVHAHAIPGRTDADLFSLALATDLRAADQRALGSTVPCAGEQVLERDGERRTYRTLRINLAGGLAPGHVLSAWWDDTAARAQAAQMKRALDQIEAQQAAFDKLSTRQMASGGLAEPFRERAFAEHLHRELALSLREHREFALNYMRLDGAAQLRATHGAAALARVCETVLHMLQASTRSMDMICQVSEDRFGILLSGVGLATAYSRMDQFRRQCANHVLVYEGDSISFQVTAGVASFPHTAQSLPDLMAASERALQQAQARGGNCVCLAAVSFDAPPLAEAAHARDPADQSNALTSM